MEHSAINGHQTARTLRFALLLSLVLGTLASFSLFSPAMAGPKDEQAEEAVAPPANKAVPAKGAESKGNDKKGEAGSRSQRSTPYFIWWVIRTSGWIGALILGLSLYFIATVGKLFVELRPEVAIPPELLQDCKSRLERRDFKGVYNALKMDGSFFSHVVTAGMAELSIGLPEARDAMERVGDVQTVDMDRKISMLAVLGTLGPMIGLLGTLQGMIRSFSAIAISGTQLKAEEVAGGISEALLLTFEGVALSVPAIYFFAVFRNRVASISAAAMLTADEFIRRLANASRIKAPGPEIVPPEGFSPAPESGEGLES